MDQCATSWTLRFISIVLGHGQVMKNDSVSHVYCKMS